MKVIDILVFKDCLKLILLHPLYATEAKVKMSFHSNDVEEKSLGDAQISTLQVFN